MKRLLTRTETDTHIIYTAGHTRFRFDKRDSSMLQRVFDRAYAYEDTGLEPEEVRSLRIDMAIIKAMFGDADVKRMKELCEADKEGRMVVLPCKVGDVVYALGYQSIRELTICSCTRIGCCAEDENGKLDYLGYEVFGKTVFLTRAEAEAAIGGGGDG